MKEEKYIGIIPARYESSRFPGKPLCDILGKPMIQWVYESIKNWDKWKKIYVATDSNEIAEKCKEIDIPYIMTKNTHLDCLDRAAEVVDILESKREGSNKYIIIQGDEPLFDVRSLEVDLSPSIINFYTEVQDEYDKYDANAVKVVVSKDQIALYFSRYSIPYHDEKTKRAKQDVVILKQICAYVFTGEMLRFYTMLKPTPLEIQEGIGLNRFLENDIDVHMRYTPYDSIGVDMPEDRYRIIEIIKKRYRDVGQAIMDDGRVIDNEGYCLP